MIPRAVRFAALAGAISVACAAAFSACSTRKGGEQSQHEAAGKPPAPPAPAAPAPKSVAPEPRPAAPSPRAGPYERTDAPFLSEASRVVAYRASDGVRIVAAGPGTLRVLTTGGKVVSESKAVGDAHALELFDVDGDGANEVVVGRGETNRARGAPASVTVYRLPGLTDPEVIELPKTSRAQIVGVAAASESPGDLYVAAFESKYFATIVRARRGAKGAWKTDAVTRVRVPGGIATLPDGRLAVARMYGDEDNLPGDLQVGRAETLAPVPTTGGVRAVIEHDGALIFADGWHREYGRKARALVSRATDASGTWRSAVLAEIGGRWGYNRLRIGDTDGDGVSEVIATGNGPAVLVPIEGPNMGQVTTLGDTDAIDSFAADLDQNGADEIIVLGPAPSIWRRGAAAAR